MANIYTVSPWPLRFWEKTVPGANGCVEWTGLLNDAGYGIINHTGKLRRAHRIAWLFARGGWPVMALDHLCHNRRCVNVAHLREATPRENSRNSLPALRTHCPAGHAYDEENTRWAEWRGKRMRQCRACDRAKALARWRALDPVRRAEILRANRERSRGRTVARQALRKLEHHMEAT